MKTIAALALAVIAGLFPALARGSHHGGFGGHHHGMGIGGSFGGRLRDSGTLARDQRHANDDYVKAASEQEDKLLDSRLKSICRAC